MKYAISFIIICSLSCKKPDKQQPQPPAAKQAHQIHITHVADYIQLWINGVEKKDITATYTLLTGDSIRIFATGSDSWNPTTGQKFEGKLTLSLFKDGASWEEVSCYCDANIKKVIP